MAASSSTLSRIWQGLQGTWRLDRKLHSANAAEPSGTCTGTASFTSREPAVFKGEDGKLELASREMLYSEKGEFEMTPTSGMANVPRFGFSRKYVWRLQDEKADNPTVTIWFVKPGTETIDYLFHKIDLRLTGEQRGTVNGTSSVEGSGGHLCIEDFYSSVYTFHLGKEGILNGWDMLHEVRGPKKDQIIETAFTKS